jgi:SAM-dependent methyltransferase
MKFVEVLRRIIRNTDKSVQLLDKTAEGIDNQSRLISDKLREVIVGLDNQSRLLDDELRAIIQCQKALMELEKSIVSVRSDDMSSTGGVVASDAALTRMCVFCNRSVEAWLPFRTGEAGRSIFMKKVQSVGSNVERFSCPHCSSMDRERHLRLFLDRLNIMERVRGGAVLHMAPEYRLRGYIENYGLGSYVRGDLAPSAEGVQQIDLQQIPYPDETFDMLICNHILEHVDNAEIALREMHRVLKRGGRAICQTPYASRLTKTFEDPLLQSTDDRLFFYGQEDHVRLFGSDIEQHFIAAGFIGRLVPHSEILPDVDPEQLGINEREPFFDFVRA